MKRSLSSVTLFLAAAACGVDHSHPAPLASLQVQMKISCSAGDCYVWLSSEHCPTVEANAAGTMDGARMDLVEQGGPYSALGFGKGLTPGVSTECAPPAWSIASPVPDEPVTEFEVSDDTGRLTFGVYDLAAARTLTWISPASGAARWGDLISLRWSQAMDTADGRVTLLAGGRILDLAAQLQPDYRFEDGVLTLRLPPEPPDHGSTAFDGVLQLEPEPLSAGVAHCEPDPLGCQATPGLAGPVSIPISVR